MIKARIIINEQANEGQYTKSFLCKLAKMGAIVIAYPEYLSESVDMTTKDGYDFIQNYIGN